MKTSSKFALVVGSLSVLVVVLAGILVSASAQSEATQQTESPASAAASGPLFNYQGELRNAAGNPITNTSLSMTFRLFASPTGGSTCWAETRSVNVQSGQFSVLLGQLTSIPPSCVAGDAYLELVVSGETLSPRERLTSVASAVTADTLGADAKTQGNLNISGYAWAAADVIFGAGGEEYILHPRHRSGGDFLQITSRDNNGDWKWFQGIFLDDATGNVGIGAFPEERLDVSGSALVRGNLDLRGTCALTSFDGSDTKDGTQTDQECQPGRIVSGAYVEANLMSPFEQNMAVVARFERGDLLCWSPEEQQLNLCAMENDRLAMAVADTDGKPIVLGAEPVKAIGPLQAGDLLVSSSVPGYAMVNNDPLPGTVIGQALESFEGESGLIKAMIRKW